MKNFDEKIRDKLFDAEMPVSDHLWNYIDSQISNKKERPKYWIFFLISLILIPSSYLGYKVMNDGQTNRIALNTPNDSNKNYNKNQNNSITTKNNKNVKFDEIHVLSNIKTLYPSKIKSRNLTKQSLSFQIITVKQKSEKINSLSVKENELLTSLTEIIKSDNSGLVKSLKNSTLEFEKGRFSGTPQCPSFNGKDNRFYAFANVSLNHPFQFLNSPETENNDYINSRNETESGFVSYAFDAGLGFQIDDNWFVQTGLMYNQINMKFHLIEEGQTRNTTYTVTDTLRDSNGAIVDIKSETFVNQEVGMEETLRLNKFKQLDIPVSLGYRLPLTRRFNIVMSAGLILNIRNQSTVTILDPKGETIDSGNNITSDPRLFKNKVGLSYTGGIKLETEIIPDLFINAGLDLRYYSGAFNSNENPIDQKYLGIGLGTGVRYKF